MRPDNCVRFLLDESGKGAAFVYCPPNVGNSNMPMCRNATLGVKFSQGVRFLDPWGTALVGMTRSQRVVFRLKHPIAYTKRGLWKLYRRVKSFFIKDRTIPCNQNKGA